MKKVKDHKGREYRSVRAMFRAYGVPEYTYYKRLQRGASIEEALRPVDYGVSRVIVGPDGIERTSIKEYADELGLDYSTLYKRLAANNFKMTPEMELPMELFKRKKKANNR